MRSHLEPDVDCVSFTVPLDPWVKQVSFFVTREAFPLPPAKLPPVGFEYALRFGKEPLVFQSLGEATARWHALAIPPIVGATPTLQIVVRRTQKLAIPASNRYAQR